MRRPLLLLAILLVCSIPANGQTITRTQHVPASCTSSPCTVTIAATGSGHLLIAGATSTSTSTAISAVSGGCALTWTSGGHASSDTSAGSADLWYCLSSSSGATSVIITISGAFSEEVAEYQTTSGTFSFDTGNAGNNQTATSSPVSAALTTGSHTDVVVMMMNPNAGVTAGSTVTGSGWTTPLLNDPSQTPYNDAVSVATGFSNTSTYVGASSSTYCDTVLAFAAFTASTFGVNAKSIGKTNASGKVKIQ